MTIVQVQPVVKRLSALSDLITGYREFFVEFNAPINEHPHSGDIKTDQENDEDQNTRNHLHAWPKLMQKQCGEACIC